MRAGDSLQVSDALSLNQHEDRTRERFGAPWSVLGGWPHGQTRLCRRSHPCFAWVGHAESSHLDLVGRFGGADEVEGFFAGMDAAFELGVFSEGEEFFEAGAGRVAGGDEVTAGE